MKIIYSLKVILSLILKLFGFKKLSQSLDPNFDIVRQVESSIFSQHTKTAVQQKPIDHNDKKVS